MGPRADAWGYPTRKPPEPKPLRTLCRALGRRPLSITGIVVMGCLWVCRCTDDFSQLQRPPYMTTYMKKDDMYDPQMHFAQLSNNESLSLTTEKL